MEVEGGRRRSREDNRGHQGQRSWGRRMEASGRGRGRLAKVKGDGVGSREDDGDLGGVEP